MSRKKTVILSVVISIGALITTFFAAPWLYIIIYLNFLSPDPAKPEITYAEFPFEIVCEIDGKEVTVKDIYVCEYDGIGSNEGNGKYIEWKGYVKSTGEERVFIIKSGNEKIYCSIGSPAYYMNDPDCYTTSVKPNFYSVGPAGKLLWLTESQHLDEQELREYGIKLISYKFSDPIENSFGEQQE